MKRITILRRLYSVRSSKGGWFKTAEDYKVLIDTTDTKVNNTLKEINKTYRSNFYEVIGDYKVSNNTGREKFLDDYINFTSYRKQLELKDLARKVLEELC